MKHIRHIERKSHKTWALPNQRIVSFTSKKHFLATRNKPKRPHARMGTSQFSLREHSILHKPMGPKSRTISSFNYTPLRKEPSRRDKHRLGLHNKSPHKQTQQQNETTKT